MPRKKTLKRKIRKKISDLEHAQEHHSSKKSIFGGFRLVLPGLTGNATTASSLPVRSKTTSLHTNQWINGEPGLEHPLKAPESERIASSWPRWSTVEPNVVEKGKNQTSPQKVMKPSRKAILQPRSVTVHDDNTSRYILAVNQGHRFRKMDPPTEPPNIRRPGIHTTTNIPKAAFELKKSERNQNMALYPSKDVPEEFPIRAVDDSESNLPNEHVRESQLTEYEYYQQRSAHGGRLGIEERIDVFEPQIESRRQYIDDLESLPLRIIAEDDTTTRASTFATSSNKSLYTPSNVTQSSINGSLFSGTLTDPSWPHDVDMLERQPKFTKNDVCRKDAQTPPDHEQVNTGMIVENFASQQIHTPTSEESSQNPITLQQTKAPLVPIKRQSESDGIKMAVKDDSFLPESTPFLIRENLSVNEEPSTQELSEAEEIDRLLAILDHIKHETTFTKTVEMPGDKQIVTHNIPPRHNSPRKVFPPSQSPIRIKDFGSEPSMSSDDTFTERLKREAFAAFDDDEDNMIENPGLSPSGMYSIYSTSLSESPQHKKAVRRNDNLALVDSAHSQNLPENGVAFIKDIQSDPMKYFPDISVGENAHVVLAKISERIVRKPLQHSENVKEQELIPGKKLPRSDASTRSIEAFYDERGSSSRSPKYSQRYSSISVLHEKRSNLPVVHQHLESRVSNFGADQSPFRSLENDDGHLLLRPTGKIKDSRGVFSTVLFPANERKTFGKEPTALQYPVAHASLKASKFASQAHDEHNIRESVSQNYDATNDLYDDSANRIFRSEVRSPMLNTLHEFSAIKSKTSFAASGPNKNVASDSIRPLQKNEPAKNIFAERDTNDQSILERVSKDAKIISQSPLKDQQNLLSMSKPRNMASSTLNKKQGYASSPIRNYWHEYSNVRAGGSFDSMSLKNDRSEETTVCGTVAQHSSLVTGSSSGEDCSYVDRCDDRNKEKRNPTKAADFSVQGSRSFQSGREYQSFNGRNVGPPEFYSILQSPMKCQELPLTEKYPISTRCGKPVSRDENINSPETEFMNFSTASQIATSEFNSRVHRAISPVKFVNDIQDEFNARVQRAISPVKYGRDNHDISKATISYVASTDTSFHDGKIDDAKITPISRYKQYANSAANEDVSKASSTDKRANDENFSFVKVQAQAKRSQDQYTGRKLPSRERNPSLGSGFVNNALVTDSRQSASFHNNCPSFDSDHAIADDLVEVLSVSSSEAVRFAEPPADDVLKPPINAILPPWPPAIKNQFSDTVACKESFEATSCITEPNDVQDLVRRTILPKPDTRWKDSKHSVYSNDLPSPLRHRLINAMSPMLSGDTMDEDSVSEWSSRYDPSRAGGSEAANAQCCHILSCFDFSTIEEKLRALCRFDQHSA